MTFKIALLVDPVHAYGRHVCQGILDYCHAQEAEWTFFGQPMIVAYPLVIDDLATWDGDGVICDGELGEHIHQRRISDRILPIVTVSEGRLFTNMYAVVPDSQAIGAAAAQAFVDRGHRHFAYIDVDSMAWSRSRYHGFTTALDSLGYSCGYFNFDFEAWKAGDTAPLHAWLCEQPRPLALFCANDAFALTAARACLACNLAIPDDVAVIGVDNDEFYCGFNNPPLSSVDCRARQIGFTAARTLSHVLSGHAQPKKNILPCGEVVVRRSSDSMSLRDMDLVRAIEYMRSHLAKRPSISEVAHHAALSMSSLERRFHEELHCSPKQYLSRMRIERGKALLATTDVPLSVIANRAGFSDARHMSQSFKRHLGQSPSSFRQSHKDR